jgi:hypothetical protein
MSHILFAIIHKWPLLQDSFRNEVPTAIYFIIIVLRVIVISFVVIFIVSFVTKLTDGHNASGHWNHYFKDLQLSSEEFYAQINSIIKSIEEPHIKTSVVAYAEGGIISANRNYLRVSRGDLVFDICGAPFGNDFFVSWWQSDKDSLKRFLCAIPWVGKIINRAFFPETYYKVDTEQMFQEAIHTILLSAIDALTIEKGLRGLTELERKPQTGKRQLHAVA